MQHFEITKKTLLDAIIVQPLVWVDTVSVSFYCSLIYWYRYLGAFYTIVLYLTMFDRARRYGLKIVSQYF